MLISPVDIGVVVITLISAFLAMLRGFSREVLSLLSWVLAAALSYEFHHQLADYLNNFFPHPRITLIIAIALIFIVSLVIISLITIKFSNLIAHSVLGPLDRFLGLFFGVARGLIVCALGFLLLISMVNEKNRPLWLNTAKATPLLSELAHKLQILLPVDFNQITAFTSQFTDKKKNATTNTDELSFKKILKE